MFNNIGSTELILVLIILLLIFGTKRLTEFGKGLGEVIREFKKALEGEDKDDNPKK